MKRKKLDLLLREKEITAPQIAKILGITGQAVYSWIWGRSTPPPATMLKLMEILNVSAEEILKIFSE